MSKQIQKMILEGIMNRLEESSDPFDSQEDLMPHELSKMKKTTPTYVVPEKDDVEDDYKHGDVHLLHVNKPFGEKETHVHFPYIEKLGDGGEFAIKVPGHITPKHVKKAFPDNY